MTSDHRNMPGREYFVTKIEFVAKVEASGLSGILKSFFSNTFLLRKTFVALFVGYSKASGGTFFPSNSSPFINTGSKS